MRDVIVTYIQVRDSINALVAWRDSGRPLPDFQDEDAKKEIMDTVKREKQQGARQAAAQRAAHAPHA